ncbi:MAG: TPM domain-containing protein [Nitrospira sp.]|nr:TPM domain-containing protein [Nitrospira sp.]
MMAGLAQAQSQPPYYERFKERVSLPGPLGYVSDHARVLDHEWKERIRSVCQDLERKTGVEMVVVTVPTIKPYHSAQEYATVLYEKWNIGSTQQEHGVMVLVAAQERQAAIALGRRMIPIITSDVRRDVGSRYLFPAIERGNFGDGLYRTVVALASPAQEVRVGDLPRTHMKGLGLWLTVLLSAVAVSTFWFISRPDLRHPYRRLQRGEYWGTGQGGFGGNWGGFGGGTSGERWR